MNKEFSNIIIFNNETLEFIVEKIEKILIDLEYNKCEKEDADFQVDIIHDNINNICVISSKYFEFADLALNKSVIRKIAKRVAQDTFMVTAKEDIAVIEKYSFNKRIYDYISFGDKEKLEELGYVELYEKYMEPIVWSNHFVGRNTLKDVDQILSETKTFFYLAEIITEIMKLYGIKFELTSYNLEDNVTTHEVVKETIYFKS